LFVWCSTWFSREQLVEFDASRPQQSLAKTGAIDVSKVALRSLMSAECLRKDPNILPGTPKTIRDDDSQASNDLREALKLVPQSCQSRPKLVAPAHRSAKERLRELAQT
jgi:hypothetical protein